jgi:hypothetical protein
MGRKMMPVRVGGDCRQVVQSRPLSRFDSLDCHIIESKNTKMIIVKVTYTVQPGFVVKNQENVHTFMNELRQINKPGQRYSALLGDDGKTFIHLSMYDNEAAQKQLLELPSFLSFQKQRDESGLEVQPKVEVMKLVASSYDVFN